MHRTKMMELGMRKHLSTFMNREDGAVTVDWVVLTAAIVGLGAIVIFNVADGATTSADSVEAVVSGLDVGYASGTTTD